VEPSTVMLKLPRHRSPTRSAASSAKSPTP
jgi:hypothetical protein